MTNYHDDLGPRRDSVSSKEPHIDRTCLNKQITREGRGDEETEPRHRIDVDSAVPCAIVEAMSNADWTALWLDA